MENRKQLILNTISDLVSDFLYYDRKEDEELELYDIENAIKENEITINEIVSHFKEDLENSLKG